MSIISAVQSTLQNLHLVEYFSITLNIFCNLREIHSFLTIFWYALLSTPTTRTQISEKTHFLGSNFLIKISLQTLQFIATCSIVCSKFISISLNKKIIESKSIRS